MIANQTLQLNPSMSPPDHLHYVTRDCRPIKH